MSQLTPMGDLLRAHTSAEGFATDMMHRLAGGALIEGYNASECYCGCGRAIEWHDVDLSASGNCTVPDSVQPTGFQCRCENWCANECGDRASRTCGECIARAAA